jgi:phosphohistidine phosphatase
MNGAGTDSATPGGRTLILVRHAKSSWDLDVDDHERPLSGRGRRDAGAIGRLLALQGLRPDLVLCSTAARTRETWDRASAGGAEAAEVLFLEAIYHAWVPELMRILREVPDPIGTLLMIGHAPGIPDLVEHLCIRTDSAYWTQLERKYPTSGLAVITAAGPWRQLGQGRARLASFVVPRG